jgi:lipopolysaccharide transport system permease protein
VVGFWAMLTPVIYPITQLPASVRWLAAVNPMTGPVEAFRWSLLGVGSPDWIALGVSCSVTASALGLGLWFFTTTESGMVDRL